MAKVDKSMFKKTEEELQEYLFVDNSYDPLLHNEFLKGIIRLTPEKTVSVKSSHARNLLVARGLAYFIGVGAPKTVAEGYGLRSIPLQNVAYTLTVVTNPRRQTPKEVDAYIRLLKKWLA